MVFFLLNNLNFRWMLHSLARTNNLCLNATATHIMLDRSGYCDQSHCLTVDGCCGSSILLLVGQLLPWVDKLKMLLCHVAKFNLFHDPVSPRLSAFQNLLSLPFPVPFLVHHSTAFKFELNNLYLKFLVHHFQFLQLFPVHRYIFVPGEIFELWCLKFPSKCPFEVEF